MTVSLDRAQPPGSAREAGSPLRVGMVLAGGGEVGIAWHAAVLHALATGTGWDPRDADLLVGTSAGSWLSALLRADVDPRHLSKLAADTPFSDGGDAIAQLGPEIVVPAAPAPWPPWPPSSPHLLRAALRRGAGVRSGTVISGLLPAGKLAAEPVVAGLGRIFGERWPEKALWLTAVDLATGVRTVFGRAGSPPARVDQAVAASCAVPAYFTPVVIGGRRYIDGGAHSAANLDLCAGLDLDLVIVSSPMTDAFARRGMDGESNARRYLARRLRREADVVRRSGTPVVVIAPEMADLAVMGRLTQLMHRSRRAAVVDQVLASMAVRLDRGLLGRELVALRSR